MSTKFLAGTAKVEITPPPGVWMSGYASRVEPAQGVHDPLWAKALVLANGETSVALVACDVIGMTADVTGPVRQAIEAECGIPAAHVMVCCSHTHSGPDTLRLTHCPPDEDYFTSLRNGIVEAAVAANNGLQSASAGWGRGRADGISANRRKFEEGSLDTEVGVLRIEDEAAKPLALLVNFACHPVTLGGNNLLFSADFPGYAVDLLEQAEPGCLALFVNGAFGNVNTGHRADLDVGDRGERSFRRAKALGHTLAGEVLKVHNAITCSADVELAAAVTSLHLPTRELPDADWQTLAENWEAGARVLEDPDASQDDKRQAVGKTLYDHELLLLRDSLAPALDTEVMALRVGDGVLAGVPAEYFIQYQIALKEAAPKPFTFLTALANDWIGYVPTREAFEEGGYETKLCRWSKMAPECGDRIYEALLETARTA